MNALAGELERILANMVRIGTIAELDEAAALVRVECGDLVTDWLHWLTGRAGPDRDWHAPELGEQVLVLSPSGDLAQGVVLAGIYQDAHPAPASSVNVHRLEYQDGASVQYDRQAHAYALEVPAGGVITLKIGGTVLKLEDGQATLTTPALLVDAPQSTFKGAVLVEGALTYQGGMTGSGGKGGASAKIAGDVQVTGGNIVTDGDVKAGNITLQGHHHMEQGDGKPTSAAQA